ncbi:hypothetical protein J7L48_08415 [bacterium]|nr:hypothetical protein [bacterium]
MKCNVPIDLRTPKSAMNTLIRIAKVNNIDEFKMIEYKKFIDLSDEKIKDLFQNMNVNYLTVMSKNYSSDDNMENINTFKIKLVNKKNGKTFFYEISFTDKNDLWYLYKINKKE